MKKKVIDVAEYIACVVDDLFDALIYFLGICVIGTIAFIGIYSLVSYLCYGNALLWVFENDYLYIAKLVIITMGLF